VLSDLDSGLARSIFRIHRTFAPGAESTGPIRGRRPRELVRLVPELSVVLASGEGQAAPMLALSAACCRGGSRSSERISPVLMLLDDLQWADPDSLVLLAYLGGSLFPIW